MCKYEAIKELSETKHYPVTWMCNFLHVTRSAYYKWLNEPESASERENERIAQQIEEIHDEHPDMGYRRLRDTWVRRNDQTINDKRVLRICRSRGIKSTIKYRPNSCTVAAENARYTAENVLNREFNAEAPNQKWVTDVSEFKYYIGPRILKVYLSAILDLYDRRIVSWEISDHNDNPLVMRTFDKAVASEPDVHPLFHSDRGFQYTSREFHNRLEANDMTQSMSRVAKCIDNGPMEGFWGMMKREMYYGFRYNGRESLIEAMNDYIDYYNHGRYQRRLGIRTPYEFHELYFEKMKKPLNNAYLMA